MLAKECNLFSLTLCIITYGTNHNGKNLAFNDVFSFQIYTIVIAHPQMEYQCFTAQKVPQAHKMVYHRYLLQRTPIPTSKVVRLSQRGQPPQGVKPLSTPYFYDLLNNLKSDILVPSAAYCTLEERLKATHSVIEL